MALSDVRWKGLKAFEVMTQVLPSKIAGSKLRSAYRYALQPTRDKMRDNIYGGDFKRRSGALWYATDISVTGQATIGQLSGIVGPRRKKGNWRMQGWHAYLVEEGTKKHRIHAKKNPTMPVYTKSGLLGFRKYFDHPGSKGTQPFSRSIESTWTNVADRVADKVAEIMRDEIKTIWAEYGQRVTGINVEGFRR